MLRVRFSWLMCRTAAAKATAVLSDREARHNISSLFTQWDDQCEPIDTGDVQRVVVEHYRSSLWKVSADVAFEWDDEDGIPSYSPYGFNGEYDLPEMQTWSPKRDIPNEYYLTKGEPFEWGEPAPVMAQQAEYKKMLNHECKPIEPQFCMHCSEVLNEAERNINGLCMRCQQ